MDRTNSSKKEPEQRSFLSRALTTCSRARGTRLVLASIRGGEEDRPGSPSTSLSLSDHNPWICKGTWLPTGSGRQFHTMRCHREIWLQAEKVKKFSGPRPTLGMIVTCYPSRGRSACVRVGDSDLSRPKSDGWVEVMGDGSGDVSEEGKGRGGDLTSFPRTRELCFLLPPKPQPRPPVVTSGPRREPRE